jgi:hypothetical protein
MRRILRSALLLPIIVLLMTTACTAAHSPDGAGIPQTGSFSWLRISIPKTWQKTATDHWQGPLGAFAWMELRDSQGAGPGAVCLGEANRGKPQAYGAYPEIRDLALNDRPACLILPSPDQPAAQNGQALYLLWLPDSIQVNTILALHADRKNILSLVESLGFTGVPETATASVCDFSAADLPVQTAQTNGLRIEAYPLARGTGCTPTADPASFDRIVQSGPAGARAQQLKNRLYSSDRLAPINARLAPFGYAVQTYRTDTDVFRALRNGKEVRKNLSWLGPVTVRADGSDFLMPVVDGYNATDFLVSQAGVQPLEKIDQLVFDRAFPVFVGNDQISLAYDYEKIPRPTESPALLHVLKNGQVVDTYSVSGSSPAGGPVRGLWSWDGHWVIELPGIVVMDGEILNDRLGTPEMFTWRLLGDSPFYFYRKDGRIFATYNQQPMPVQYDEVISQSQLGANILLQMRTYEYGLAFYAREGDTWYYVVMETK